MFIKKRQATLAIACLYLNLSHLSLRGASEATEYMLANEVLAILLFSHFC
jgi:hypothetical protein